MKVDRGSDFAFRRLGLLCVTRSFFLSSRFDMLADYHLLGNDRQGTYTALEEVSSQCRQTFFLVKLWWGVTIRSPALNVGMG